MRPGSRCPRGRHWTRAAGARIQGRQAGVRVLVQRSLIRYIDVSGHAHSIALLMEPQALAFGKSGEDSRAVAGH
eukprot:5819072-Lingulodinium_polyedra.AAC.1